MEKSSRPRSASSASGKSGAGAAGPSPRSGANSNGRANASRPAAPPAASPGRPAGQPRPAGPSGQPRPAGPARPAGGGQNLPNSGRRAPAGQSLPRSGRLIVEEPVRALQDPSGQSGRRPGASKSSLKAQSPAVTGRTIREAKAQKTRVERPRSKAAKRAVVLVIVVFLIAVALLGVYYSPLFKIQALQVEGASYLSSEQLTDIAQVPADSTLLRLDSKSVIGRLETDPWVASASLKKVFPSTLVLEITERQPVAVVAYDTTQSSTGAGLWLVSGDNNWLTELSDLSAKQRAQLLGTLPRITDLPKDATPAPGPVAAGSQQAASLQNALTILQGLSPDFAAQVASISAPDTISTGLQMADGLQVSFGQAEDISLKESVIQGLISEKGDSLASINVRVADKATFRLKDGSSD